MTWTVQALADALALPFRGDGSQVIVGVRPLASAGPENLGFVADAAHAELLNATRAGAVLVPAGLEDRVRSVALIAQNPHVSFARAAQLLHPDPPVTGRIAASAEISPDAVLRDPVDVGPGATVGADVRIGSGSRIGAGCVIEPGAILGAGCMLAPRVVIGPGCHLGDRVRIQPGAVIGGDGFGFARDETGWIRVPQVGRVVIEDDVEIGANTTIDRGAMDDTVIEKGAILDNQIQVAHNVRIGEYTAIAGCVGIAGSTTIGNRCQIGGGAGIIGHLTICDDVVISAMALVSRSIDTPGRYSSGTALEPHDLWKRNIARLRQLDRITRRLVALEKGQSPDRR